ncbi:MAG: hypothetical protein ACP5G7_04130 [Anaerolineae bacterium]
MLLREGYPLLVTIRPDLNYPSSGRHHPDDPTCGFRVYRCCFQRWHVPGAIAERRELAAGEPILRPTPTDLFLLSEYLLYELFHGRRVAIWFHPALRGEAGIAEQVRTSVREGLRAPDGANAEALLLQDLWRSQPGRLRQHAARDPSWLPTLLSHATPPSALAGVLRSGALLSATALYGLPGQILARQRRNIPCDPPDYFRHVMFMLGDDRAIGDWVVYQRLVDRSPTDPEDPLTWDEFADAFVPTAKLYFASQDLLGHPDARSDGFHDLKMRGRVPLAPYLAALVIPSEDSRAPDLAALASAVGLGDRVVLLPHRGADAGILGNARLSGRPRPSRPACRCLAGRSRARLV